MLPARDQLKRVQAHSRGLIWTSTVALVLSLSILPTPSPAATANPTAFSHPIRGVLAVTIESSAVRAVAPRPRTRAVAAELADFTSAPTPSDGYVVTLIHQDFPARAWHAAEAVAWCESKFRTTDIGFDSNGTHDRGLFQLN